MKIHLRILLCILCASAINLLPAQNSRQLITLLPQIDGWHFDTSAAETFNPENLHDRINGAADIFLVSNFREMTTLDYAKPGGKPYITLELYRHATPADAFAVYSAERTPESKFIRQIGAEAYTEPGILYFLSGPIYAKLGTSDKSPETAAAMEKIARQLAVKITPENDKLPPLLAAFPAADKLPRSETYIVESPLGHKFLRNAYRAAYSKSGKEYTLYLIDAGTKPAAEKMLLDYLAFTKQPAALAKENQPVNLTDRFNGDIQVLWQNQFLVFLQNDNSAEIDTPALLKNLARQAAAQK